MSRNRTLGARSGWALALLGALLLLAGCAGGNAVQKNVGAAPTAENGTPLTLDGLPKNANGYADVTAGQLSAALPAKAFTLVNVHIPYEGELPQTDLFVPYNQIDELASKLPDKGAPIVLYCRSGRMSTEAARNLVKLGYTNLMELNGGMGAWESAGLKLQYTK